VDNIIPRRQFNGQCYAPCYTVRIAGAAQDLIRSQLEQFKIKRPQCSTLNTPVISRVWLWQYQDCLSPLRDVESNCSMWEFRDCWQSEIYPQDTSPNCQALGKGLALTLSQWLLCTQVLSNSCVLSTPSQWLRKSEYSMIKTPSSYSERDQPWLEYNPRISNALQMCGPELSMHRASYQSTLSIHPTISLAIPKNPTFSGR
jgi:hypothetical protein